MKKLFLILLLAIGYFAQAQDLPTEPSNGFSFPLGSKFTIKLTAVDSSNYDYSVIAFEAFHEIIDSWKNDDLFADKGADSTIVCYFCVGTHGDTEEEREKNMKIFLLMKNYTQMALKYTSEIQREEDGEYEETSNVGLFPGVKTQEIWPYMIQFIGIREFRNYK